MLRRLRHILLLILLALTMTAVGFALGSWKGSIVYAAPHQDSPDYSTRLVQGMVPKSYGRVAAVIPDQIGTGLIFEDSEGTIRFVSMTGMKEGELARYEGSPTHGGIPKSYGHLVGAVVNPTGTGLVFEDGAGTIRFVTITGKVEGELTRK
jgi:hypothetical protein